MSGFLLWDNCMVWGLALHHSYKFLSHLRKLKLTAKTLVPFLWSKVVVFSPHFYANKFYKGSQTEGKCQISLLLNHSVKTTQFPTTKWPRCLSAKPWVFLNVFQFTPSPVSFHWVGNSPGIFKPHPPTPITFDWVGTSWCLSTEPHSLPRPWVGMPWIFHLSHPHPQYFLNWEGTSNLLHHHIKLRMSTRMGDLRTTRDLAKFICTPREDRWAEGTHLLVPKLWFLVEFRWRKSTPAHLVSHCNRQLKRCITWELWVKFYLGTKWGL